MAPPYIQLLLPQLLPPAFSCTQSLCRNPPVSTRFCHVYFHTLKCSSDFSKTLASPTTTYPCVCVSVCAWGESVSGWLSESSLTLAPVSLDRSPSLSDSLLSVCCVMTGYRCVAEPVTGHTPSACVWVEGVPVTDGGSDREHPAPARPLCSLITCDGVIDGRLIALIECIKEQSHFVSC